MLSLIPNYPYASPIAGLIWGRQASKSIAPIYMPAAGMIRVLEGLKSHSVYWICWSSGESKSDQVHRLSRSGGRGGVRWWRTRYVCLRAGGRSRTSTRATPLQHRLPPHGQGHLPYRPALHNRWGEVWKAGGGLSGWDEAARRGVSFGRGYGVKGVLYPALQTHAD